MKNLILATSVLLAITACSIKPNSNEVQKQQQELSQESNSQVGMPNITTFQEKRMLKQILELRDTTISTITYMTDMNGNLHKLCDSVGYGLPYSTQYTNPQHVDSASGNYVTLPQADPNGLFSPVSANGTWVLCLDPNSKKTVPVYIEPNIIVSPFALK
jgi:hypothetical protein